MMNGVTRTEAQIAHTAADMLEAARVNATADAADAFRGDRWKQVEMAFLLGELLGAWSTLADAAPEVAQGIVAAQRLRALDLAASE